ncbi:nucleotidyl transferase AbiEii/AbiGii toxin family protein [Streptomyces sp. NBC_00343]|uniref:nucleotidyl transferase AbiEii/AbiGii toxin family protein n=1 Tax=Streptomyces sp. NBC_00343 TaxID=2975719 RepID=UPI002E29EC6E|nr:nucleotidyl transferase AbiEii/AbiGii toxin family protein [Streptomyces sp. NBC_00343]
MADPTRDTTAGRVYNDLRNLARRASRSTDEIMVEYVLERFLYRLATSPLGREHFVLKGGLLLAQFGARRMTRDIDILGRSFPGTETETVHRIAAIAATGIDDGVVFDPATLKTVPIRRRCATLLRSGRCPEATGKSRRSPVARADRARRGARAGQGVAGRGHEGRPRHGRRRTGQR